MLTIITISSLLSLTHGEALLAGQEAKTTDQNAANSVMPYSSFIAKYLELTHLKHALKNVDFRSKIKCAKKDQDGWTALHMAASYGHLGVVNMLLACGADTDAKTNNGSTPFLEACTNGHLTIAKLLHAEGCDWKETNNLEWSPLKMAALFGHYDVVEFLISIGADVDQQDINGYSALSASATRGHLEIVQLLLTSGATIDLRNNKGRTPFFAACKNNRLPVAKLLYEQGCDWQTASNGKSPLKKATELGHTEIVSFLKSIGA